MEMGRGFRAETSPTEGSKLKPRDPRVAPMDDVMTDFGVRSKADAEMDASELVRLEALGEGLGDREALGRQLAWE